MTRKKVIGALLELAAIGLVIARMQGIINWSLWLIVPLFAVIATVGVELLNPSSFAPARTLPGCQAQITPRPPRIRTTCSVCGCPMTVIQRTDGNLLLRIDDPDTMRIQGCFMCASCDRYACYEHSFSNQTCKCGHQQWEQAEYLPDRPT